MKVPALFEEFLSRIEPAESSRNAAISAHTTVRDRLASDDDFKAVHVQTFLAGSYRRHTAIQPIKDTDIIVITNLDPDAPENTPSKVLNRLRAVLNKYYKGAEEPKTSPQRRSIRIDLSVISMDILPAVAPEGAENVLLIPDRVQKEWIPTHPKGHIAWATALNDATKDDPMNEGERGRFIPLVKMTKWMKKEHLPDTRHPKGFVLECLAGEHQDSAARDWEGVVIGFLADLTGRYSGYSDSSAAPYIKDPGMPGHEVKSGLTAPDFRRFLDVANEALSHGRAALSANTSKDAAEHWRKVFGPRFPLPEDDDHGTGAQPPRKPDPSATVIITGSPRKVREAPGFGSG